MAKFDEQYLDEVRGRLKLPTEAEYNKVTAIIFTNIVKQKKNRSMNWK